MLAYHNNPQLKQEILQQLQGSSRNVFIEDYKNGLGIPKTLIYLHDAISRGLPNYLAKNWPIRFISAVQVGADLSCVWADFAVWMLIDPIDGVIKYTQPGTYVYHAIMQVAQLYQDGRTRRQMRDASFAAASFAAASAASESYIAGANAAGYIAANIAHVAGAEYVYAAAHATRDAVRDYSAYAGAHATRDDKNDDIYKYARNVAYMKMSNKLIELLQNSDITRTDNVSLSQ